MRILTILKINMIFLRPVFAILVAPFRWLESLFQHKDNLLELHFSYGSSAIQIKTINKEVSLSDDLLIASYLLFWRDIFIFVTKDRLKLCGMC